MSALDACVMLLSWTRRAGPLSRRTALLAGLTAAILPRLARAAPTGGAAQFITEIGQRALGLLRATGTAPPRQEIAALLDEAVDLPLLARLVLGRHWSRASEEERTEYLALFRAYALQGLTSALSGYTGHEQFRVTGIRPAGDGDSLVGTSIVAGEGRPTSQIDWRVREGPEGFVIVDVVAEGVSLLVTNRAEFDSIVSRSGIDGLLREMRSWYVEAGGDPAEVRG